MFEPRSNRPTVLSLVTCLIASLWFLPNSVLGGTSPGLDLTLMETAIVDGDVEASAGFEGVEPPPIGIGGVDRTSGEAIWTPGTHGIGRVVAASGPYVAVGGDFTPMGRGGLLLFSPAVPIFTDGFESGDTSAWSVTVP